MSYRLDANTVEDFDEFTEIIADYVQHHTAACVAVGGQLSRAEASGRAKELVEAANRRHGGELNSSFNDARDGTNGGMRAVLDGIAEGIKAEALERYIRDAFDRHVAPNSWDDKVDMVRQFIDQAGPHLSSSIDRGNPERYAQNYKELIRSYADALQRTSSLFRRL